jgi:hypothetical protein
VQFLYPKRSKSYESWLPLNPKVRLCTLIPSKRNLNFIVLSSNKLSYDVIPYALQQLHAKGYRFVSVAQCLGVAPYQSVQAPQTPTVSHWNGTFPLITSNDWLWLAWLEMLKSSWVWYLPQDNWIFDGQNVPTRDMHMIFKKDNWTRHRILI